MSTSIKLEDDLRDRIQRLAEQRDRSVHWLMREAIRQYLDREEQQERALQEALDAWGDYQETGRALAAGPVQAWLARWGEDDEQEPPACRA